MKILFDHCVPEPLRHEFPNHHISTTFEMGWSDRNNGELLRLAGNQFDLFFTVDQSIEYQQSLKNLPLPVVVLVAPNNRLQSLLPYCTVVGSVFDTIGHSKLIRINSDYSTTVVA